jgi:integrase/recombinase XerD
VTDVTLSQGLERFDRHLVAVGRSIQTRQGYGGDLRRFLNWARNGKQEDLQLDEVTIGCLEEYLVHLHERGLADKTRRRAWCAFRTFFAFCKDAGLSSEDPSLKLIAPQTAKTLPRYLDSTEVRIYLDKCHDPLVKVLVGTLYYTGARINEACSIYLGDVDFRRRTLTIRVGKGGKQRVVPLNRKAREILLAYMVNTRPEVSSKHLFITKYGADLKSTYAGRLIREETRRQGCWDRVTAHTFRHSCATALLQRGVGVVQIGTLLGHANLSSTQLYCHVSGSDLEEAVDLLDLG